MKGMKRERKGSEGKVQRKKGMDEECMRAKVARECRE